ncbi:hypothetical protein AZ78_2327 [Lysobacter capsici AZ78]|jgi:hypothetical protein|uniref:Uncharacterized protein n=1 Tax=Lysobacter capsici AZ78 TaxID=1444315 RepID=A0A125MMX6_9GAMM|nr:hypothetical protein [Lysobacter capsici]KWS04777.1 hypothetical protein AZ78_2327 [Lysobacter capsici AZ78]
MNRKTFDDKNASDRAAAPGFDDPRMEREWQLQERAQREERAGAPIAADDPRLAQYRLLTRALRAPVMEPIPFGFAEQVARRAQAVAAGNDRVERYLQQLLLGGLVVLGLFFAWSSSAGWAPALLQELPRGMWSWGPVVAACCAVTWGWDGLARMTGLDRGRGGHAA